MFAFALWDAKGQRLFAARDRVGVKPLYYYADANKLVLASEIKAIIEDGEIARHADMTAVSDYLYTGRALSGKTMFRGIRELEPGHSLSVDLNRAKVEVRQYWDLHYNYNTARSAQATEEELFSIVDEAVAIHCRSDAPVGCHLSGGIDSSSVVGFAARHRDHLKTFSIRFSDDVHIDETKYAKAVAQRVGAQYLECSPTADDMADLLPFLIWHMDVPMATDGGFAYFTVSEFAKKHVKVSLTGHGGDEVFAGYPAQFQAAFNSTAMFRLYQDPDRIPQKNDLMRRLLRKGPVGVLKSMMARAVGRRQTLGDLWASLHNDCPPAANPLLQRSFIASLKGYSSHDEYVKPFAVVDTDQTLDKCLYHDLKVYLPSLLHLEDRVSMAVSLESRVPLLDHEIVEFLATVPPGLKVAGLEPKHLLRKVAASLVPAEVLTNNDKRGFPVPGKFWRTPRMTQTVREILLSDECMERGIFSHQALREACEDFDNVTLSRPLVNLELWFKIFIDQRSPMDSEGQGSRQGDRPCKALDSVVPLSSRHRRGRLAVIPADAIAAGLRLGSDGVDREGGHARSDARTERLEGLNTDSIFRTRDLPISARGTGRQSLFWRNPGAAGIVSAGNERFIL